MLTYSVEQYVITVDKCRNGKLTQEQALKDINKNYKHTLRYIKQKMTKIMEKHKFYRFVSDGIDGLISIYETMEQASGAEHKNYLNIFTKIINDYLAEDFGKTQKINIDLARIAINEERSKIADLCQIKNRITESYEKAVLEIASLQKTLANQHEPELIPIEKMPPRIQKMYTAKIITGEKINGRWIVSNEKHGIKVLMEWADKNDSMFPTSYVMQTFCKRDGNSFTRGSINTFKSKYGFTGNDE